MAVRKQAKKKNNSIKTKKAKAGNNKFDKYAELLLKLKDGYMKDISQMAKESNLKDGDSGDVSGHVFHMADVATDMYDREFNLELASNERASINKIDQALKRIKDGIFGMCSACEKPIPVARIKALPYTETCLKCQEKIENEG
jgi:DnaK suppressor protein